MATAGQRAYKGGLGAEPPARSRGRAPGGPGAKPLKLKGFCLFNIPRSSKIYPLCRFLYFEVFSIP